MAATLNYSTLHACENVSNTLTFTDSENFANNYCVLAESEKPAIVGAKCLDLGNTQGSAGVTNSYLFALSSAQNMENKLANVWFYVSTNKNYISVQPSAIQLRLYAYVAGTVSTWDDLGFFQYNMGGRNDLNPGWNVLFSRGYNYDHQHNIIGYSRSLASITHVGVTIIWDMASNANDDVHCAIDEWKLINSVDLNGGMTVNTMQQIYDADQAGAWGVCFKTGNYYRMKTGLTMGGNTTTSRLQTENEIIHFDSPSPDMNIQLKFNGTDNAIAIQNSQLLSGALNSGHAVNGSLIKHTCITDGETLVGKPWETAAQESGIFSVAPHQPRYDLYDTALTGWDRIDIGYQRTDSLEINTLNKVEFTKCKKVNLISDNTIAERVEIHHMDTDAADASLNLLGIYTQNLSLFELHNNINAVYVSLSQTLDEFFFENNTMDIQLIDTVSLILRNLISDLNTTKIELVP